MHPPTARITSVAILLLGILILGSHATALPWPNVDHIMDFLHARSVTETAWPKASHIATFLRARDLVDASWPNATHVADFLHARSLLDAGGPVSRLAILLHIRSENVSHDSPRPSYFVKKTTKMHCLRVGH